MVSDLHRKIKRDDYLLFGRIGDFEEGQFESRPIEDGLSTLGDYVHLCSIDYGARERIGKVERIRCYECKDVLFLTTWTLRVSWTTPVCLRLNMCVNRISSI